MSTQNDVDRRKDPTTIDVLKEELRKARVDLGVYSAELENQKRYLNEATEAYKSFLQQWNYRRDRVDALDKAIEALSRSIPNTT